MVMAVWPPFALTKSRTGLLGAVAIALTPGGGGGGVGRVGVFGHVINEGIG